jgi:DNA-binding NarL/FixJ family response regulator
MSVSPAVSVSPLSIAVADDHPAVLEGLAAVLAQRGGFHVAARAGTAQEVRDLVERAPPAVLVLDLMLREEDGLALIKDLAVRAPAVRIIVFSLQPEEVYAERCLRAGAHGYVMKPEPVETLFAAIRAVAAGGLFFSPRITALLLGSVAGAARKPAGGYAQLTDRELQVFRLTGLALTSRQIAEKLGVSVKTVEAHRENIKNKLGLESGPALVARAALWVRDGGAG